MSNTHIHLNAREESFLATFLELAEQAKPRWTKADRKQARAKAISLILDARKQGKREAVAVSVKQQERAEAQEKPFTWTATRRR